MKKTLRFLGSFAIMAVIGLTFITCRSPIIELPEPEPDPVTYHTVTFQANGGTPAPEARQVEHGSTMTEPQAMSRDGHGFGGWFLNSTFEGSRWNFQTDTVTRNITLYAKWTEEFYTVTFVPGYDLEQQVRNVSPGSTVTAPSFDRPNAAIVGWYRDAQFTPPSWDFNDPVTEDMSLYARWLLAYTVNFDTGGGTPQPPPQQVFQGYTAVEPPVDPERTFVLTAGLFYKEEFESRYSFGGWLLEGEPWDFDTPVVEDITLTALWTGTAPTPIDISSQAGSNIVEQAVSYVDANPEAYVLVLDGDVNEVSPQTLTGNIQLAIMGIDVERTIRLSGNGSLFTVNSGVTLTLDNNITLEGHGENTTSLVQINTGGTLVMNEDSKITGNTNTDNSNAGGVFICSNATFEMNGGEISSNTAAGEVNAGGVLVAIEGNFEMSGGKISDNTTTNRASGGGVLVANDATFTMSGGEISDNNAAHTSTSAGGVLVVNIGATFTMSGGEISGNTTPSAAGGVLVWDGGIFYMSDGKISNNTALSSTAATGAGGVRVGADRNQISYFTMDGGEISGNTAGSNTAGGVLVAPRAIFTMNDGKILDNTATDFAGGGVRVFDGTFTMNGGEISGNTAARAAGGGVSVSASGGIFTMNGGEISGNTTAGAGDGVYVENNGNFEMTGGEISGNFSGFGVVAGMDGNIRISGGIIHGSNANARLRALRLTINTHGHFESSAHFGDFNNDGFEPRGFLFPTNATIQVINGDIQGQGWCDFTREISRLIVDAQTNGEYTIDINADMNLANMRLSFPGRSNITLTLRGVGAQRTVRLSQNGRLFTVPPGTTLILENITLEGRSADGNGGEDNTTGIIHVMGTLIMNEGSRIVGNTVASGQNSAGGGVHVGAHLLTTSTLIMNEGSIISGNTATGTSSAGGVRLSSGTLRMNEGSMITDNTATGNNSAGGVRIERTAATFTMTGGEISGNTAESSGSGGGVVVTNNATFTMNGGEISGNTTNSAGGGVRIGIGGGTFDMTGGEISGNFGGFGVSVESNGNVRISDGIIHGSNADVGLRNVRGALRLSFDTHGHFVSSAHFGDFNNDRFEPRGFLFPTNATIQVIDGGIQGQGWCDFSREISQLIVDAQTNGQYTIDINADTDIANMSLSFPGRSNITLTLRGVGAQRTVRLSQNGRLFIVPFGTTLILENITLEGRSANGNGGEDNTTDFIHVMGTLIMNEGSRIIGNTAASGQNSAGGGVRVGAAFSTTNSNLIMNEGSIISGNTSRGTSSAGGVWLGSGTTLRMNEGSMITDNTATGNTSAGGVNNQGTLQIASGVIHGSNAVEEELRNTATGTSSFAALRSFGANASAMRGTFTGDVFTPVPGGNLANSSNTIHVINGNLEP